MAVSKVGLGWPAGERNYTTLRAWRDALINSGQFEEAWCKGDLGSSAVTISGTNFSQGALIRGDVQYTGANKNDLAKLSALLTVGTTAFSEVRDLYIVNGATSQSALSTSNGNLALRCHVEHTGLPGTNGAVAYAQTNSILRNCVAIAIDGTNNFTLRTGSGARVENCIGINGQNAFYSNFSSTVNTDSFFTGGTNADALLANGATTSNCATTDGTGNVTGFTTAEFVNFAAGDYRIKSNSQLKTLGIGAFFEEGVGGGAITATAAFTMPQFGVSASAQSTSPVITATSAFTMPQFIVAVSSSSVAPGAGSTVEFTIPQFVASASAQSVSPVYSATISALMPQFTAAATASNTIPAGGASVSFQMPQFSASATAGNTAPVYSASVSATMPHFAASVVAQSATGGVAASIAYAMPQFSASVVAFSSAPVYAGTVSITMPQFGVSILSGEFAYFGTPSARIDWRQESTRIELLAASIRIDYTGESTRIDWRA
jgi:hypothetical protein